MATTKKKKQSSQSRDRATITQAISFDWEVYDIMEEQRKLPRIATPRSAYVRQALEEKFIRMKLMTPRS